MSFSSLSPTAARPRITGNDIPDDIWRNIAMYLQPPYASRRHLYRLISVNRTFFHVVLTAKYGEVRWIMLDRDFIRLLERLQNPIIAGYVQTLSIRAWFIDFLLKRDALLDPSTKAKGWMKSSLNSILAKLQPKPLLKHRPPRGLETKHSIGKLTRGLSSKEIVKSLINAVSGMKNVTQLNFEWRDLPLNKDTQIFLTSTRMAFDTSLRKLVLRAQISKFKELLAITNFDNLDELDFHFDYRSQDANSSQKNSEKIPSSHGNFPPEVVSIRDPEIQDLSDTVIPFINHRRSYLRSLIISSSSSVDLSEFFSGLPSLPALRRFGVRITVNERTLSDPSGILHILQSQRSILLYVSLVADWPDYTTSAYTGRRDALTQKRLQWSTINDKLLSHRSCLSGLESLEIPFVSLTKTIPLLGRSSDTLTRLCLMDSYLSVEEITAVVGLFAHRPFELRHLHIEVALLHVPLIEMLATRLPGLESLVLVCETFLPFITALNPESVALSDWKLSDIGIYVERYQPPPDNGFPPHGVHSGAECEIMLCISKWVPSIRTMRNILFHT
ncbi:hypothetical protein BDZ97DRAFT_1809696 [Flammula alnicola]|nr:hypothetical protein BDZ97DRAFT_1809696 [Flammula alnicola]